MKIKQVKGAGVKNRVLIGICSLLFLILLHIIASVSAEDSITAYCYRDNRSLGSVVIFETETAARACNNVYYECKGKCVGCFHDFDYFDYVCVDTAGRTFLR